MAEGRSGRSSQLKYVQVLTAAVWEVPGRVDGYHRALTDTVADILALEAGNVQKKTNITQKVAGTVDSLGKFLVESGWTEDGGGDGVPEK